MRRTLIPALLALLFLTASPGLASLPMETVSRLDSLVAGSYAEDAPGAAILVAKDGEAVYRVARGMADLELDVALAPYMVFRLGSITKQFTSVAILQLVQQGRVHFDDSIQVHLPDYNSQGRTVTVEQLLNHTSGIANYTGLPEARAKWREDLTTDELIELFEDEPFDFEPGTDWKYNNSAYVLLGAIIEKVSGMSYAAYVDSTIFEPLGMENSHYGSALEIIERRVDGYQPAENGGWLHADYISMTLPHGAGGLLSSVDDLLKWDRALDEGKVVSKQLLKKAWTPASLVDGRTSHYGYGWAIMDFHGYRSIEHGGGIDGFRTYALRIPEKKLFVAILSNQTRNSPDILAKQIARTILGVEEQRREAVELAPSALEQYVGVYRKGEDAPTLITLDGEKLHLKLSGGSRIPLVPAEKDTFMIGGRSENIVFFERGDEGEVRRLVLQGGYGPDILEERTGEDPQDILAGEEEQDEDEEQ